VILHPKTKFPAQAALPRGLAMGFSVNAPNLADGHPCPTTAGKLSAPFFIGLGLAQLRRAQLAVVPLKHRKSQTLPYDNGKEFCGYALIDEALKSAGYFARTFARWERGTNENFNGLLR
jgi:hypothetical protein